MIPYRAESVHFWSLWYTPEILVMVVTFVSKVPTVTGMGPPNLGSS